MCCTTAGRRQRACDPRAAFRTRSRFRFRLALTVSSRSNDGTADAILLHDTFLLGFKKQDPNTTILAPSLATTDYGIAVAHGHEDLVRFLNRLLLDMREDGRLEQLYDKHFAGLGAPADMPPLPAPEWID